MVNHSQVLSLQKGSLWELACEAKPADDFITSSLYLNGPDCFIYSEHISRADENKLMNRTVTADCRRIDILKVNIENFHLEDARAATGTDTTSDR